MSIGKLRYEHGVMVAWLGMSAREPEDALEMKHWAFQVALLVSTNIIFVQNKKLQPLVCNSVNELPAVNAQSDFVYVTTRGRECTFIFQGPGASQLDLKVHSFSTEGPAKTVCKKPPVEVFSYSKLSKLRQLERVLCAEDDIVRMVTETNTAIITSTLGYGSFFVKVRPLLAPVAPRLVTQTNRYSTLKAQRRADQFSRRRTEFFRLNEDYLDQDAIDGMYPPDLRSIDFFSAMNQFEIPIKFRAQPQGFTPSLYYPGQGNARPTDSYGAPVTTGPILWGPYPGRPGPDISITSTSTQNPSSEWISSSGPTSQPVNETATDKPIELTTASTLPARETEPLTSQLPSTTPMPESTAGSTSTEPETGFQEASAATASSPPTSSPQPEKVIETETTPTETTSTSSQTFITNTTTVSETEISDSDRSSSFDQPVFSVGFKPVLL
ncbi:Hypothetical protein NTJ_04738 [Nesidiocoris tenuis]|uniref:Uncharacterized protein n=1 Tax=Nesidiocoris tenuis TaxID=355587 RepID=A0ABN7AI40_9HEMI|nr:Hypothetical protein NTJ_04738 [Nesidiocoris tenuis]